MRPCTRTRTTRRPTTGDKKVAFTYDYQHRRVEKRVYDWDPQAGGGQGDWSATPSSRTRFMWDGWLMLLELDGLGSNAVLRKYTWGLDLAGQREGRSREAAGGIGGLLAVRDEEAGLLGAEYVYAYDAAGNVGQLVNLWVLTWNADGVMKARYEYDPYGNVTSEAGTYAATNRIRFSTKYFDAETGLGYWGRRYYRPDLGRWLNRDPIDEAGGLNLYAYVRNTPANAVDALGALSLAPSLASPHSCPSGPGAGTPPAAPPPVPPAQNAAGGYPGGGVPIIDFAKCMNDPNSSRCAQAERMSKGEWCYLKLYYEAWLRNNDPGLPDKLCALWAGLSAWSDIYLWIRLGELNNDKWMHCYAGCVIGCACGAKAGCYAGSRDEYNDLTDCAQSEFEFADDDATCQGAQLGAALFVRAYCQLQCQGVCDRLWSRKR